MTKRRTRRPVRHHRHTSKEIRPFGIPLGGWLMIGLIAMIVLHGGAVSVHR